MKVNIPGRFSESTCFFSEFLKTLLYPGGFLEISMSTLESWLLFMRKVFRRNSEKKFRSNIVKGFKKKPERNMVKKIKMIARNSWSTSYPVKCRKFIIEYRKQCHENQGKIPGGIPGKNFLRSCG